MPDIIRISDGLGNQLSEYAFARKLQRIKGGNVYLDNRFINNEDRIARGETGLIKNGRRKYTLDKFRITLPIADDFVLSRWDYLVPHNFRERQIFKLAQAGLWPYRYKDEEQLKKGKRLRLQKFSQNTYFKGYYFDLYYYDDIRPILQKEIRLKTPLKLSKELRRILRYENTISLHIRRGDYVEQHISICRDRYYSKAVKMLDKKVEQPVYLVFSDDIEWVKENLNINATVLYISEMGFADYEEFTIMKHCRHNIIANSTFSYWAAYLNNYPEKIVIYPASWGKNAIMPEEWYGI